MDNRIKLGLFFVLFSALSLVFFSVNLTYLVGAQQESFTMFQFIGPVGAGLFSPLIGIVSVLFVEILNGVVLNPFQFTWFDFARFFPMVAAAYYFGTVKNDKKFGIALPLIGMALFWMNPVGAQAWGYALLWLIPIAATFLSGNLYLRSLGATFQAHIVGSIAFLYTISMPAAAWWALIPIVLIERGMFAAGISLTYVAFNSVLGAAENAFHWKVPGVHVEKQYALLKEKKEE